MMKQHSYRPPGQRIFLALFLSCLAFSVFAKDAEVSLLFKISLKERIDPFYARTFGGNPAEDDLVFPDTLREYITSRHVKKYCKKEGELFFVYCTYPRKEGKINFNGFYYLPYGIFDAYIVLPFMKEITVPEGADYVYIGTLEYDIDPKTFQVRSMKLIDEYDEAKIATPTILKKKKAELVRLPENSLRDR